MSEKLRLAAERPPMTAPVGVERVSMGRQNHRQFRRAVGISPANASDAGKQKTGGV